MRSRHLILFFVAMASASSAMAQDDFGTWTSAGVSKKLDKHWSVNGELELRTANDVRNVDSWRLGVGGTYRFNAWLKADAGYTFIYDYHPREITYNAKGKASKVNHTYFSPRHRAYASLTATKSFAQWKLSLRERWQYTWRPEKKNVRMDLQDDEDDPGYGYTYSKKGSAKHTWRNKVEIGYKINKTCQPHVSGESYLSKGWDKLRFKVGTDINLSKHHSLDVGYLYQKSWEEDETDRHIVNIGYKYKF